MNKNIAQIVEKLIEQKPFLQEALGKQIINHAALAETLIPEIENIIKTKVKFSTVNMAIRRLSEKINKELKVEYKFNNDTNITLKSKLIEITTYKTNNTHEIIKDIYKIINFNEGDFLTITHGLNEIMFITNTKNEKAIKEILPPEIIKKEITNLSSITINISDKSYQSIGLFYIITRALNWSNINIIDIVSTLTEMTFIIKNTDAAKAYESITKAIEENTL